VARAGSLPVFLSATPPPKGPALKTTVLARVTAIAVAALALTACSAINPITTQKHYQASDGVSVDIGDHSEGINLLVMTTAAEAPAVLTGSIHNSGTEDLSVKVSIDAATTTQVDVPAGATVALGTAEGQTLVQGTSPSSPGGLAPVLIGSEATGLETVDVPVVDGTLSPYNEIVDSIPPLPEPSPSASPSA
jgi:hypothetical protein